MALYFGHETALAYWLTRTSGQDEPEYVQDRSLALAEVGAATLKGSDLPPGLLGPQPLHLLTAQTGSRRRSAGMVVHSWSGEVPPAAFCCLRGGDRIASPEFAFLLMAPRHTLRELVEWGCYLCGGFAVAEDGHGYAGSRRPLTTPDDIRTLVASVPGAYGARRALEALEYVVPNLASPMEVFLAMECVLPASLGGFALPPVVANEEIVVPPRLRLIAGTRRYYGDLLIPSVGGDIEYDSYEFHTGPSRLDHDATRRNVLEALGIKTVTVTYGQVETFQKLCDLMWMIEERFGIDHREWTGAEEQAQMDLYDFLLNPLRRRF